MHKKDFQVALKNYTFSKCGKGKCSDLFFGQSFYAQGSGFYPDSIGLFNWLFLDGISKQPVRTDSALSNFDANKLAVPMMLT